MNKEQFEKMIDEKLASLKAEMMQKFYEQEDEFQYGDEYYYLTTRGNIEHATWRKDGFDKAVLAIGNRFKTEEKAKIERERRKVIKELKKYAELKDRQWDGENRHYYIVWDNISKNVDYDSVAILKGANIYFETKEIAEQAVEAVGADRVKRFYLGVEE